MCHVCAWAHVCARAHVYVYVLGPMCVFGPMCVLGPMYMCSVQCVCLGPCVHVCVCGPNLYLEEFSRVRGERMSFFYPFCNRLNSFFELLALPLENLGVKTVRSIHAGFDKHAIETFDSLACLEPMRRDAFGIQRMLMNFLVWLDDIKILGCKWVFTL